MGILALSVFALCLSHSVGSVLYESVGTELLNVTFKQVSYIERTPLWKRFRQNQGESRQGWALALVCVRQRELLSHTACLSSLCLAHVPLPLSLFPSLHFSVLVSLYFFPSHHLLHICLCPLDILSFPVCFLPSED